jgi:hypothetical protein
MKPEQPKQQREDPDPRFQEVEVLPRRGQPRISKAWLCDGLDASSDFGDDTTSPKRIAELIGRTR